MSTEKKETLLFDRKQEETDFLKKEVFKLLDSAPVKLDALNTILNKEKIPQWQSGPALYLLPLCCIFLGNQYRQESIQERELKVLWPKLCTWLLSFLDQRQDEESGLPYIQAPSESLLAEASYWSLLKGDKIFEPAFIGLLANAMEELIYIGGLIKKNLDSLAKNQLAVLLERYEFLAFCANDLLWNEEYGLYLPVDSASRQQVLNNSVGGLLPLIADLPSQEQAEAMYRALSYNFVHDNFYYFPTECVDTGKEERSIDPLVNWLMFQGLIRFEFKATAKALQRQIKAVVQSNTYLERFTANKKEDLHQMQKEENEFVKSLYLHLKRASLKHHSN